MIVDLMRNDLSKIADKGTVNVDELCEVYTYKTVHQMISKISCKLKENYSFTDILKHNFSDGIYDRCTKNKSHSSLKNLKTSKGESIRVLLGISHQMEYS